MQCVLRWAGKLAVSLLLVSAVGVVLVLASVVISELEKASAAWHHTCASSEAQVPGSTLAALCGNSD